MKINPHVEIKEISKDKGSRRLFKITIPRDLVIDAVGLHPNQLCPKPQGSKKQRNSHLTQVVAADESVSSASILKEPLRSSRDLYESAENQSLSADEDGTPKLIGKGDNSSLDSHSSDLSDDKINTMNQETPIGQSQKSGKGTSHYSQYQTSKRKPTTKSAMMCSITRDLMEDDSPLIPQLAKPIVSHRAQKSKKGASEN